MPAVQDFTDLVLPLRSREELVEVLKHPIAYGSTIGVRIML